MVTIADADLPLESIFRWETERAERVFLTQPREGKVRDWTWAEAVGEARRMAAWLKAQGWEPGSRVAILSKNCAWWIMADLAIWMAGHVTVPIYPSLRAESVRYILEHSESKACFVGMTDEREATLPGIPPGVLSVYFPTAAVGGEPSWNGVIAATPPMEGHPTRRPDDVATIFYTSGTTGVPKGVVHSFAALALDAKMLSLLARVTPQERVLSYLPLAHIVERAGMEGLALQVGFRLFFAEGLETFLADLQRARPTLFLAVPRLLMKFQQGVFAKTSQRRLEKLLHIPVLNRRIKAMILRRLGLDQVRFAVSGAATLPAELLRWYRNLGLDLGEGYGMTEILITHVARPGRVRPGSVGLALDGVETKLGPNNELLVRSPMNMLGYYKDPVATRAAFTEDGFMRTGDVVSVDPDGETRIVGRIKEEFKTSKGKYVAPGPIESKLMAHSGVECCCLMGAGLPGPFAIVLLSDPARQQCADPAARKALEDSLLERVKQVNAGLDPFERVIFLAIVDGPWTIANNSLTPTLKVRRAALEERYGTFVQGWLAQNRTLVWESAPEGRGEAPRVMMAR